MYELIVLNPKRVFDFFVKALSFLSIAFVALIIYGTIAVSDIEATGYVSQEIFYYDHEMQMYRYEWPNDLHNPNFNHYAVFRMTYYNAKRYNQKNFDLYSVPDEKYRIATCARNYDEDIVFVNYNETLDGRHVQIAVCPVTKRNVVLPPIFLVEERKPLKFLMLTDTVEVLGNRFEQAIQAWPKS